MKTGNDTLHIIISTEEMIPQIEQEVLPNLRGVTLQQTHTSNSEIFDRTFAEVWNRCLSHTLSERRNHPGEGLWKVRVEHGIMGFSRLKLTVSHLNIPNGWMMIHFLLGQKAYF